jgi:LCP family protein required for cell wall assembly
MKDPSPPPSSRIPYRRPESGGDRESPRHRVGTHSGVHTVVRARRWPRRTLITANVLVALTIVGAAGAYGYVKWRFGQIHTKTLPALTTTHSASSGGGGGPPFTLLVVGSDSRAALTGPDAQLLGGPAGDTPGQRSDTIILVRVVPKTRQMMILSIPRDLWGPIPGQGDNRINSAFGTGANLLVQTIEADLNVPINHYVEVNFNSFRDITSAVGGVKFYFPTPSKDLYSDLWIPAPGCYNLTGDQALEFVRSRHYEYYQNGYWHYEAQSDLARIQRQQAFIKKMIKKAAGQFTNPLALNAIIGGVTKNLTVDSGFSPSLMLTMVKDFRSMDVSTITNLTLPTYAWVTSGGADVLGLQQPQANQVIAAFNAFGAPAPKPVVAKATPTAPVNTLPPVTVAPAGVSIEVANGTGTAHQASQMTTLLTGLGYHATVTAALSSGHTTTEVRYAPDARTAAQQVAAQIPGGATLLAAPDLAPSIYSLQVITGASFTGAASSTATTAPATTTPAGAGALASATPTTPTTLPGTNSANYQLPGSTPGVPTPPC